MMTVQCSKNVNYLKRAGTGGTSKACVGISFMWLV